MAQQEPILLTAWKVTGQPVLALPNGLGRNGLPLGMQIVGRPVGESTILRVGHAYDRAPEWHTRSPQLVRGAAAPEVTPAAYSWRRASRPIRSTSRPTARASGQPGVSEKKAA